MPSPFRSCLAHTPAARAASLALAGLLALLLAAACGGAPATGTPAPLPPTPTAGLAVSPLPTPTAGSLVSPLPTPASGTTRYASPEGWSFDYPARWNRLERDLDGAYVQDTFTGKTVHFQSAPSTPAELEAWLQAEIERKLAATEAANTLAEPLAVTERDGLRLYRYTIASRMGSATTLLRNAVFFDSSRRIAFRTAIPPVTDAEFEAILDSFRPAVP